MQPREVTYSERSRSDPRKRPAGCRLIPHQATPSTERSAGLSAWMRRAASSK
jgi:hypothetical protein